MVTMASHFNLVVVRTPNVHVNCVSIAGWQKHAWAHRNREPHLSLSLRLAGAPRPQSARHRLDSRPPSSESLSSPPCGAKKLVRTNATAQSAAPLGRLEVVILRGTPVKPGSVMSQILAFQLKWRALETANRFILDDDQAVVASRKICSGSQ